MKAERLEADARVVGRSMTCLRMPGARWWLCDEGAMMQNNEQFVAWARVVSRFGAPLGVPTCLRCMSQWLRLWRVR